MCGAEYGLGQPSTEAVRSLEGSGRYHEQLSFLKQLLSKHLSSSYRIQQLLTGNLPIGMEACLAPMTNIVNISALQTARHRR